MFDRFYRWIQSSRIRVILAQSPRKILFLNSLILAICFAAISAFSLLVCWLFYTGNTDNQGDTIFVNWLIGGIIGIFMVSICIVGMRGAHLVSFELLLIYFWGITMFIGPLILAAAAGFNFYFYMTVWITHYWDSTSFALIRETFCAEGTAEGSCAAPANGYPYPSVDAWCTAHDYTNCRETRDAALKSALEFCQYLLLAQSIMGIFNVLQIGLSMYICTNILTSSVITQSMNDSMNYLLMLPIGGCCGLGVYTLWMSNYELATYWVPYAFFALSAAEIIQIPLGIAAGRLKSRYMLAGSIVLLSLIIIGLAATGIGCILFAILWSSNFTDLTSSVLQEIACNQNLAACCCCHNSTVSELARCPEWSNEDVIRYVLVTIKISGIVSLICTIYFFGAIAVGEVLRQNLKNYKSEYI